MFLYFDLGNVLLHFDHQRACRQVAEAARIDVATARKALFDDGLQWRYESGELDTPRFCRAFAEATAANISDEALLHALSDIFETNRSMIPVVGHLDAAGHRLGILSNTCEAHWRHVTARYYGLIPAAFDVVALSYEAKAMKPDRRFFDHAARLAGVPPRDIFYVDDIPGHVEGARGAGFDAVPYTTTRALVDDLRERGVRFNY